MSTENFLLELALRFDLCEAVVFKGGCDFLSLLFRAADRDDRGDFQLGALRVPPARTGDGFDLPDAGGEDGPHAGADVRSVAGAELGECAGEVRAVLERAGAGGDRTGPGGQSGAPRGPRPRPLAPRLTEAEAEAHADFIARLGESAVWRRYSSGENR